MAMALTECSQTKTCACGKKRISNPPYNTLTGKSRAHARLAELLGLKPTTLLSRIKKLGIEKVG
jgi:transcriptional regulator with GAF, ATPase, and Fis domain